MITSKDFTKFVKENLKGKKFIVAIQRETYLHVKTPHGIEVQRSAGGAHSLLDGILNITGGLMVALGQGDADMKVVDSNNCIAVPPKDPKYILKRIFIKKKEMEGFYYGFANQTLWPLCHAVFIKPIFNATWWEDYVKVNERFADAILQEIGSEDGLVWVNDYHLALLPKLLKQRRPTLRVGVFWHIPWPTYEIFRICPWRKDIMAGLLGADFIGFHRGYHVENFIECARRDLEVLVDSEPRTVKYKDQETKLANLPAGIDFSEIEEIIGSKKIPKNLMRKDFDIETPFVGIGVDRLDYTKGIAERIKMLDRFFEKYKGFIGKVTFLFIEAPSRVHIPAYKTFNHEVMDLVEKVNWKYGNGSWQPLLFVNRLIPRERIFPYYHLADVCLVTSLDDGMNLVAKEYVICSQPQKGMLLLSKFTGAAKGLKSALLINPYDIEGSADALYLALTMDKKDKKKEK